MVSVQALAPKEPPPLTGMQASAGNTMIMLLPDHCVPGSETTYGGIAVDEMIESGFLPEGLHLGDPEYRRAHSPTARAER